MNCVNQFAWLDYTESGFGLAVCGYDRIRVRNTDANPIKILRTGILNHKGWAVAEQVGESYKSKSRMTVRSPALFQMGSGPAWRGREHACRGRPAHGASGSWWSFPAQWPPHLTINSWGTGPENATRTEDQKNMLWKRGKLRTKRENENTPNDQNMYEPGWTNIMGQFY
jgi:hypothetical protein